MDTLLRAGLSNAVTATVLALLVACLSRPLARRPAILHGLWLLVLIKLVTPPIYEVAIPWPKATTTRDESVVGVAVLAIQEDDLVLADDLGAVGVIAEDAEDGAIASLPTMPRLRPTLPAAEPPIDWRRWTAAVWIGGSLVMLVVSWRRIRRFQRLIRSARPATDIEREWVETLASGMGLRRIPEICWVRARVSPLVWPLGRPRLIIPRDLWKTLDGPQRSTLVVHELAHLKRGDHLVRFLELVVTALYWWHPLLWLIRQSLRDAEEQCCDAWVVWTFPEAAKSYAETLLDTLDFVHRSSQAEPLLASGLGKVPHLRRRLTMIMTGTTFRVLGVRGTLGLLALAGVLLPVGATWAQQPQEPLEIKVQVKTDTVLDEPVVADVKVREMQEPVAVRVNTAERFQYVVADRVDGQVEPGGKVVVSGSRDEVIKELEARIAELKKGAAPTEAGIARIKALVGVLDNLKRSVNPAGEQQTVLVRLRAAKEAKAAQAAGDAAEIAKLKQEVARIKGTLDTSLKELKATQEKIRKLGGDPGETPVVTWRRSMDKTQRTVYRTYAYTTTPGTVTVVDPADRQGAPKVREVRVMALEPEKTAGTPKVEPKRAEFVGVKLSPEDLAQVRKLMDDALMAYNEGKLVEATTLATKAAEIDPNELAAKMLVFKARTERQFREKAKTDGGGRVDPDRLELLEKRLKALQEEVNGMKKGSK